MRIYVGNLSYSVSSEALKSMFEPFGTVDWAEVQTKVRTGRSRGFGLVDMPDDDQGRAAIEALDGKEIDGRALSVNESRPRRSVRDLYAGGWSASARR